MTTSKSADISECEKYRYRLDRWWANRDALFPVSDAKPTGRVGFLMLNPSTADANQDDATIRKCMGFARRWGFSGITVVNLFAYRSRTPDDLIPLSYFERVGVRNLSTLHAVARDIEALICAWGCESVTRRIPEIGSHIEQCVRFATRAGVIPEQLGPATKSRAPRHPLMASYNSPRIPFGV